MSTTYSWGYTDTFGGEAIGDWVRRGTVTVREKRDNETMANYNAMSARAIKKAAGLNGVRGRSDWQGDRYEFRPYTQRRLYKSCTALFAWYIEW